MKKLPLTAKQREAWPAATPRERPSDLLQRYEATVRDLESLAVPLNVVGGQIALLKARLPAEGDFLLSLLEDVARQVREVERRLRGVDRSSKSA